MRARKPQSLNPICDSALTPPMPSAPGAERLPGGGSRYMAASTRSECFRDIHRNALLDPLGMDSSARDPPEESRFRAGAERTTLNSLAMIGVVYNNSRRMPAIFVLKYAFLGHVCAVPARRQTSCQSPTMAREGFQVCIAIAARHARCLRRSNSEEVATA
jgi:hypothetical protein